MMLLQPFLGPLWFGEKEMDACWTRQRLRVEAPVQCWNLIAVAGAGKERSSSGWSLPSLPSCLEAVAVVAVATTTDPLERRQGFDSFGVPRLVEDWLEPWAGLVMMDL